MADILLYSDDVVEELTPLTLTTSTSPLVTATEFDVGYTLVRTGGSHNVWEGQAYGNEAYTGGVYTSAIYPAEPADLEFARVAFGVAIDPTVSDSFNTIDYAFLFGEYGAVCQNKIDPVTPTGQDFTLPPELISKGDLFSITYDGTKEEVCWKQNGQTIYSAAAASAVSFRFDSSFKFDGSILERVRFNPLYGNTLAGDILIKDGLLQITPTFAEALKQRLSIKFKLFKGEYVYDLDAGIDYYSQVLKKGVSKEFLDNYFIDRILETDGVVSLVSYSSIFNAGGRVYEVDFTVTAEDGSVVSTSL